MAIIADLARVTQNLQYVFEKEKADNLYDLSCDAFLADCEDLADDDNGGRGFVVQLVTRGNNANPTFGLAGTGSAGRYEFVFAPVSMEWKARWTRNAQLAAETKGNVGVFDLAKSEIEVAMNQVKNQLGITLGGKGWGTLAGIGAVTTGANGTITVAQPDGSSTTAVPFLLNRFQEGQILCAADSESSGTLRGSDPGDSCTIVSIDYVAGVLTCDNVPATFAVGDYLSEKGFRNYDAANGKKCMTGLEGWLDPVPAVNGDSFGGRTRYNIPGLQPRRMDFAALGITDIREALLTIDEAHFSAKMPREGLAMYTCPQQFRQLTNAITQQAQVVIQDGVKRTKGDGSEITIGYSSYMLQGMGQAVPVIPSVHVRPGLVFFGPFKSKTMGFKLRYGGRGLINQTIQPGGSSIFYIQAGIADNTGVLQAGWGVDGFSLVQLTCAHPGNYYVGTNLTQS